MAVRVAPRLLQTGPGGGAHFEPLGGSERLRSHLVATGVARVADDDEFRVGPGARELPRCSEGRAEVEAAVDDHAGNASKTVCVTQEDPLLEPRGVGEVMRTDADESKLAVRGSVAVRVR